MVVTVHKAPEEKEANVAYRACKAFRAQGGSVVLQVKQEQTDRMRYT